MGPCIGNQERPVRNVLRKSPLIGACANQIVVAGNQIRGHCPGVRATLEAIHDKIRRQHIPIATAIGGVFQVDCGTGYTARIGGQHLNSRKNGFGPIAACLTNSNISPAPPLAVAERLMVTALFRPPAAAAIS